MSQIVELLAIVEYNGEEYTVKIGLRKDAGLDVAREIVFIELENQGIELPRDIQVVFLD